MTHRDYKLIADSLIKIKLLTNSMGELIGINLAIKSIIISLAQDNPRFNKEKFERYIFDEISRIRG